MNAQEMANLLTNYAKTYHKENGVNGVVRNKHMNAYRGDAPIQELVDAVVVDFVNFIMVRGAGMDLGLYTKDIQS